MKAYEYIVGIKDKASTKLKQIAKSAGLTDTRVTHVSASMQRANLATRAWSRGLGVLKSSLVLAYASVISFGAFGLVSNMVRLGAETEKTRIQFEVLTQSVDTGRRVFNDINALANATPFKNADLQKNATTLLSFGTKAGKVVDTLRMLGDVAGGDKEKLDRLTLAFSQAMSTGKLMGQDLLQMINAGFNPLNEISIKTGKSIRVLIEEMRNGNISAKMLEQAFVSATSEGGRFYGMMDRMSKTLSGRWSTLIGTIQLKMMLLGEKIAPHLIKVVNRIIEGVDALEQFFTKTKMSLIGLWYSVKGLGGALYGVVDPFISYISSMSKGISLSDKFNYFLGKMTSGINILTTGIKTLQTPLKVYAGYLGILTLKTGVATVAQIALNAAQMLSPTTWLVLGLVAFTGAIVSAYKKVDWFRGGLFGLWEVMKALGGMLVNVGKGLAYALTGQFKKAGEQAKLFWQNGTNLGKKWQEGFNKGVAQVRANTKPHRSLIDLKKHVPLNAPASQKLPYVPSSSLGGTSTGDIDASGLSGVTSGGAKQTHITINLGKLQEQTVINSQTVQEGLEDMEERIMQIFLRLLNSANQLQTS